MATGFTNAQINSASEVKTGTVMPSGKTITIEGLSSKKCAYIFPPFKKKKKKSTRAILFVCVEEGTITGCLYYGSSSLSNSTSSATISINADTLTCGTNYAFDLRNSNNESMEYQYLMW